MEITWTFLTVKFVKLTRKKCSTVTNKLENMYGLSFLGGLVPPQTPVLDWGASPPPTSHPQLRGDMIHVLWPCYHGNVYYFRNWKLKALEVYTTFETENARPWKWIQCSELETEALGSVHYFRDWQLKACFSFSFRSPGAAFVFIVSHQSFSRLDNVKLWVFCWTRGATLFETVGHCLFSRCDSFWSVGYVLLSRCDMLLNCGYFFCFAVRQFSEMYVIVCSRGATFFLTVGRFLLSRCDIF